MNHKSDKEILDRLLIEAIGRKHVHGAVLHLSSGDQTIDLLSAAGEMTKDSSYYIASINKLFITAMVLRLCREGRLSLDNAIGKYLPHQIMQGLHVYKGREYSDVLTIRHLLAHTSGLPCYLTDKQRNGKRAMKELEAGIDQAWPFDKVVDAVKGMKPHFAPGARGRAKYGDTNFQLLSLILENVVSRPINRQLGDLFRELDMTNTFVYEASSQPTFVPIRYKSEQRFLPQFLSSTQNDIISTARDQMIFLRAFFSGYFLPKESMKELECWNRTFFPFENGVGMQKFSLPRILSPFRAVPEMIGHCGSTGSVAFYVPKVDLYITGTVNQQASPGAAFQLMIRAINALRG